MRPPYCRICKIRFSPSKTAGGLVYFKLTPEEAERKARMIEKRMKGHPPGREWFCEAHIAAAKELTHLSKKEALVFMNNNKAEEEE